MMNKWGPYKLKKPNLTVKNLNYKNVKIGDKIVLKNSTDNDAEEVFKGRVVELYPRRFRVKVDRRQGTYYQGILYADKRYYVLGKR